MLHQNVNNNCLICGEELDYLEIGKSVKCHDCGKEEIGYVRCKNDHYVCDDCHGDAIFADIFNLLSVADGCNPLPISEKVVNNVSIPMLGCEHAWIAAGALMVAIRNQGIIKISDDDIMEVLNRTRKQAIGAFCGLTGVCGIAPAIGAVYSVLLGASCPKSEETAATMNVVSKVIEAISKETGPSCCKNFLYTSLKVACDYTEKYLGVQLPTSHNINCIDSHRHPHGCREELCNYYSSLKRARQQV